MSIVNYKNWKYITIKKGRDLSGAAARTGDFNGKNEKNICKKGCFGLIKKINKNENNET